MDLFSWVLVGSLSVVTEDGLRLRKNAWAPAADRTACIALTEELRAQLDAFPTNSAGKRGTYEITTQCMTRLRFLSYTANPI